MSRRRPPIFAVPRGKTHEVRVVDLLPEGKYRDYTESRQVNGFFSDPRPVLTIHDDKIITTWYVNAYDSKDCRNPIGTEGTLNPSGNVSKRGDPYTDVQARSKLNKIEYWANHYPDEVLEHSDYSPEAMAARQRAAQQAQQAHEAAELTLQAEIDRLREQLRKREESVEKLNQLVGRKDAQLRAKTEREEELEGLVADLERQLQARPTGHGGHQPDEDDEDEDNDIHHFTVHNEDGAGHASDGGADGVSADGDGGNILAQQQQQRQRQRQQQQRGRHGRGKAKKAADANDDDGATVGASSVQKRRCRGQQLQQEEKKDEEEEDNEDSKDSEDEQLNQRRGRRGKKAADPGAGKRKGERGQSSSRSPGVGAGSERDGEPVITREEFDTLQAQLNQLQAQLAGATAADAAAAAAAVAAASASSFDPEREQDDGANTELQGDAGISEPTLGGIMLRHSATADAAAASKAVSRDERPKRGNEPASFLASESSDDEADDRRRSERKPKRSKLDIMEDFESKSETEEHTVEGNAAEEGTAAEDANNWKEATDKASGQPYYYNTITNETTWDKPKCLSKGLPRGVRFNTKSGKYTAKIQRGGTERSIGTFNSAEEASIAYNAVKRYLEENGIITSKEFLSKLDTAQQLARDAVEEAAYYM